RLLRLVQIVGDQENRPLRLPMEGRHIHHAGGSGQPRDHLLLETPVKPFHGRLEIGILPKHLNERLHPVIPPLRGFSFSSPCKEALAGDSQGCDPPLCRTFRPLRKRGGLGIRISDPSENLPSSFRKDGKTALQGLCQREPYPSPKKKHSLFPY